VADELRLTIDGQAVTVPAGTTILDAARAAGIDIPVLCYFEHTTSNGLCRLCVVETEGARGLQAACVSVPRQGSTIHTRSENVERAADDPRNAGGERRPIRGAGPGTTAGGLPGGRALCRREERRPALLDDNPMYIRDYAKCVLCWRCVQVCAEDAQYTYAINFTGRGFHTSIGTFYDKPMPQTTCVFCGQCVGVCPTGALKGKREFLLEQGVAPEAIFEVTREPRRGRRRGAGDEDAAS
jgi:NADH dehydrogenase/NADH:ubiquinone oxidoreductase subunit G